MADLASSVYGYIPKMVPAIVNNPMEDNRPGRATIGGWGANHHSLGHQNPLFWLLLLGLLVLGYIGLAFDVKVGK